MGGLRVVRRSARYILDFVAFFGSIAVRTARKMLPPEQYPGYGFC